MKLYYERRAPEYDSATYEQTKSDPATRRDLDELVNVVASLSPGRVLDIGCGTGWLTRFLRGPIVALDQSESMLRLARTRLPHVLLVHAEVPPLPFVEDSFLRAVTSHVYGHLEHGGVRRWFVAEALRVARELVVIEQAWHPGLRREGLERRQLADGSEYSVYKRYFTAADLGEELGGEVLLDTPTFVAARVVRS